MFGMFTKRPSKNFKDDIGAVLADYKPISLWTKARVLTVDDIHGGRNRYDNVGFKVTDKALIINDKNSQNIVYNLENVIKYFYQPYPPSENNF